MKKRLTFITCIVSLMFVWETSSSAPASEPPVILISPFHIVSSGENSLIRQGIDALLSSRFVSDTCPVRLLEDSESPVSDINSARTLAQTHQGDYLVYGTVVKFGETLTVDAFLFDRAGDKIILHDHDTGKSDDVLIKQLSTFSSHVMDHIAGPCYSPSPEETVMPGPPQVQKPSVYVTNSTWKSQAIKGEIVGMCVDDLDGDSHPDAVIAQPRSLMIKTFEKEALIPQYEFTPEKRLHILGVDCADLNGNGTPEIFVSMVRDDNISLDSLILEWNGSGFKTLAADLPWVFRTQPAITGEPPRVLIQKNKSLTSILGSGIQRLAYTGNAYQPAETVQVPKEAHSLFSVCSSRDDTGLVHAFYTSGNMIRLYDSSMNLVWESDEAYGGGSQFMALQDSQDSDVINRLYLDPRLMFLDLDGDRLNELVAVQNLEAANHLLSSFKYYKKGRIVFFRHGDIAWRPVFSTETVPGYISDFCFYDMDADKRPELIYAFVAKEKGLFSKKSGYIVVQKWATR